MMIEMHKAVLGTQLQLRLDAAPTLWPRGWSWALTPWVSLSATSTSSQTRSCSYQHAEAIVSQASSTVWSFCSSAKQVGTAGCMIKSMILTDTTKKRKKSTNQKQQHHHTISSKEYAYNNLVFREVRAHTGCFMIIWCTSYLKNLTRSNVIHFN